MITAKDVAALRAQTGLGMMDCKKALVEAEGDMEKAVKILREKGLATAEKKAGCTLKFGWDMLMEQGKLQFESFTGYHYPKEINLDF